MSRILPLSIVVALLAGCADEPDPRQVGSADWHGGYAALQAEDWKTAETDLLAAQKNLPDDAYVALSLGVAEQNLGKKAAARAQYERAEALGKGLTPRDVTDPHYAGMTVAQLAKADLDALPP